MRRILFRVFRPASGRAYAEKAPALNFVVRKPSAANRIRFGALMLGLAFIVLASQMTAVVRDGQNPDERRSVAAPVSQWRADIVDRNGELLATNAQTHSLYAHPQEMSQEHISRGLEGLGAIFPDLDAERLRRQFTQSRKFIWIRDRVSPRQMQAVIEIGVPGLHFGKRQTRIYPNGRLGSHILGGTRYGREDVNWAEILGVGGVEKGLEPMLTDKASGIKSVTLSMDLKLQGIVEEVLAHGVELYSATAGAAILMDARTGEILSLASFPDFDPNNRDDYFKQTNSDYGPLFNSAIQGVYELGSTFKVFAAAQAIDLGLVNASTMIETTGLRTAGKTIKDYFGYGEPIPVEQVVVKSSNVGAARLGLMIGGVRQQEFLEWLGLTRVTNIEVAEAGIAKPLLPGRWGRHSTITVSFGHGISVSPAHLASAYAVFANGGCRVDATLLKREGELPGCDRVISETTSRTVADMLGKVVREGTATKANLDSVQVGGKTGTADKVRPNGGYYKDRVIATFASVFPVDEPRYVLVVTLDEPTTNDGSKWQRGAGNTVVPVAGEIISRVSPFLLAMNIGDDQERESAAVGQPN